MRVHRLQVPNTMAALEPARREVLDFLAPDGLTERVLYRVELVLEETLMNRLWHAHPDGGPHLTDLQVRVQADAVELQFDDDGMPFNPLQVPERQPPTSLAEAVPGGLGLVLTRKAASHCSYDRVQGRNIFTVRVARV